MDKYNDSSYRDNIRESSKSTGSILKGIIFGERRDKEVVGKEVKPIKSGSNFFSSAGQYKDKGAIEKAIGKEKSGWSDFSGNPYKKEIQGLKDKYLKNSYYDEGKIKETVSKIKSDSMWNSNYREKKAGEMLAERLENLIKKNQ